MRDSNIKIRNFLEGDIKFKIKWINNLEINKYLHYDIPISYDNTLKWYNKIEKDNSRIDCIIETNKNGLVSPIGLIGIINMDNKNLKAELYILIGEKEYWHKNIAYTACCNFIGFCFKKINLNKIYLFTEEDNNSAIKLFKKVGFKEEGFLKEDLIYKGKAINRYMYSILRKDIIND